MVGHSGLSGERLVEVTASTRILPLGTWGATEELAKTPSGMSPATSACAAGAPPLYGTWTNLVPVLSAIDSRIELIDAAVAGRTDIQRVRLRLGGGDHVGDRFVGTGAVGGEHHRRIAHRGDRRKIALDVIGHLLEQRRIDRDVAGRAP